MPQAGKILIVDDEVELTNALSEMLAKHGYEIKTFAGGSKALNAIQQEHFDVLLVDLMMPEMDGIMLLKKALEVDPLLVGIMMTGQGTVQTAVEAMKTGAFDYLQKPFKLNNILSVLARSMEVRRLREENVTLRGLVDIYELGQVVSLTLDTKKILDKTAEAALQVAGADEISILLPHWADQEFEIAVTVGADREFLHGKRVPFDETIEGWVALNQEMLILRGPVIGRPYHPLFPRQEIGLAVSMPMLTGKSLVGIINANLMEGSKDFTDDQLKGLSILANIAAAALENARLYEETEKRLRMLTGLRVIDQAITSSLDLRATLSILLDQVSYQLGVEQSAVFLSAPKIVDLKYSAGRGFHSDYIQNITILPGTGQIGEAVMERKTIVRQRAEITETDGFLSTFAQIEPFDSVVATPLIARGQVEGVLVVFGASNLSYDQEWIEYLEDMARQAAIAIDGARLIENLQRSNLNLTLAYDATIEGWSRALDLRDEETEGHTQRVTDLSMRLATWMNMFDEEELIQIRRGAILHDIGKMGVPDRILRKPKSLNEKEAYIMRKHPEYAYKMLRPITYLRSALDIPLYHHERWDGTGYPHGLKGDKIPLSARIFSVADVWDALSHERPYRKAWPIEKVLEYLQNEAGKQFDPQVVEAFLEFIKQNNITDAASV